jgi:transposase
VEAVVWIARTGSPWRDLPAVFGKWNSLRADAVAGEHLHRALVMEAGVGGVAAQGVEVAQPCGARVKAVALQIGP